MNTEILINTIGYLVDEKSQLDEVSDQYKLITKQITDLSQLIIDTQRQYLIVNGFE